MIDSTHGDRDASACTHENYFPNAEKGLATFSYIYFQHHLT